MVPRSHAPKKYHPFLIERSDNYKNIIRVPRCLCSNLDNELYFIHQKQNNLQQKETTNRITISKKNI